jgi:pyruvate formate lyase activating enzyme
LDTSGCVVGEKAEKVLEYTDLCLLDVKFDTEQEYKEYAGGSLTHTLEFLKLLEKMKKPTWIRRVIVPGINDNEASAKKLGEMLKGFSCVEKIEFLPFRKLCTAKYDMLRTQFPERSGEFTFRFEDREPCPAARAKELESFVSF